MKFLCDVHIPYKIVRYLRSLEFETIHVNEILEKWHTKDLSTSILIEVISENLKAIQKLNSGGGFMIELDRDSVTFIKSET